MNHIGEACRRHRHEGHEDKEGFRGLYEGGKSQILDPRLLEEVGDLSMSDHYGCIIT